MSTATETVLDTGIARQRASQALACRGTRHRIGLELEWHVYDPTDHTRRIAPAEVHDAVTRLGALAPGVTTSVEPGGQIELDTPPLPLTAGCRLAARAAEALHVRLDAAGLVGVAVGADPLRRPENLLDVPRYRAMATTFAARGDHGVAMMANTAAFQINIDLDADGERWRLVHQLGPVLVAAFANSPVGPRGGTGWQSHRLATWWAIDPSRTRPVDHVGDPGEAWLRYALDADVLLIRRDGDAVAVTESFSFQRWLHEGHPLGPPTVDDFDYHLSTLFPPVRPRGYLELRFLDALGHPHWLVAAALVAGLVDTHCVAAALAATEPAAGRWMDAARLGLGDESLASMAADVTDIALAGLVRGNAGPEILEAVRAWRDGELARGHAPASSVLDRWVSTGTVAPGAEAGAS